MVGVMPLISVIVEPELSETNKALSIVYDVLGKPAWETFIYLLAAAAVTLMAVSMAGSLFIQHVVRHFAVSCQNRLSYDLVTRAVSAPYLWFLDKNAAMSAHHVSNDVLMWSNDSILRLLNAVGQVALMMATAGVVMVAAPMAGLIGLAVVGLMALLVMRATQRPIAKLAITRRETAGRQLAAANQVFSGIKDIKLSARESFFVDLFHVAFSNYGRAGANMRLLQAIPPIFIMFLGQSGLILIALVLWQSEASSGEIAAQMALIVLVTSRVIPAVNRLIAEISGMWAAIPHVGAIFDAKRNIALIEQSQQPRGGDSVGSLNDWQELRFDNVGFAYPGSAEAALDEVSLRIERGASYGVVGPSGAGKSTAIDLILGLVLPTGGNLLVDDEVLSQEATRSWQQAIGYVPQAPFMADDSLRANVAFGVPTGEISDEWVLQCLEMAHLSEWFSGLEYGLDTRLGDRGTMLSGGQRQRVAIARALYNRPSLLVLDEATSALDAQSEQAVHAAVESLHGQVTTIIIAHRFGTVRACDSIFLFEQGRLLAKGTFSRLYEENALFRRLAGDID